METVDANGIATEPLPAELVRRRPTLLPRCLAELRLPLGGPYRPRARLYRFRGGRLLWLVRLWEVDHAVPQFVETDVLRTFATRNRLPGLAAALDGAIARATEEVDREPV